MAFWIVYQGNSWDRARRGGYLWAPKVGKKGQTQAYWATMERVRPGDLIFSGVDNALRAIAEATLPAYTAERPDPMDDQSGMETAGGWMSPKLICRIRCSTAIGCRTCWERCRRSTRPSTAVASPTRDISTRCRTAWVSML